MLEDKPFTVEFVPGCFDSFDGTQEELDDLIKEIKRLVETGEIFEMSEELDYDTVPDHVLDKIDSFLEHGKEDPRKLN